VTKSEAKKLKALQYQLAFASWQKPSRRSALAVAMRAAATCYDRRTLEVTH